MPNPWDNPKNPYVFNAFRIAGIDSAVISRTEIRNLIERRKTEIAIGAEVSINGENLDAPTLNNAKTILEDPNQRISEELLEHRAHKFDSKGLDSYFDQAQNLEIDVDSLLVECPVQNIKEFIMPIFKVDSEKIPKIDLNSALPDFGDDKEDIQEEITFDL